MIELWDNKIGDEGCTAFAECGKGALAQLERLDLALNQIGDAGLSALADAVAKGGMAKLNELPFVFQQRSLLGYVLEHPVLKAVCEARGIRIRRGVVG